MDKSDVQEILVHLYLRLNGYFVSGFIVHAARGVKTEIDILAIRFPKHEEPEREIGCSGCLKIPADKIDFLVGEVKGGQKVKFNSRFRGNQNAVRSVLQRFGAFDDDEICQAVTKIPGLLDPGNFRNSRSFPSMELKCSTCLSSQLANLRFILFAPERRRAQNEQECYIMQDDMIDFIWKCFRPDQVRENCAVRYNFELWGPPFAEIVGCFKDKKRRDHPTLDDIYAAYKVSQPHGRQLCRTVR
jgi:hypothetical protein